MPKSSAPQADSSKSKKSKSGGKDANTTAGSSKRAHAEIDPASESEEDIPAKKKKNRSKLSPKEQDEAWRAGWDENLTDEEVLEKQRKSWHSEVYRHFESVTINNEGPFPKYNYKCKLTGKVLTRARYEKTTTNLKNHVSTCTGKVASPETAITAYTTPTSYNKGEIRLATVKWVARRARPYRIVADPEFQHIIKTFNPAARTVVESTVSDDVIEVYKHTQPRVAAMLQEYFGFLHLSFDGWTAANVLSFLGVVVHLTDGDGHLKSFILDFIPLRKRHTGTHLAEKLYECLKIFGIEKKIFGLVGDNASNNDSMIEDLELLLSDCPAGSSSRVRCICHVMNLAVGAIIRPFNMTKRVKVGKKYVVVDSDDEDDADDCDEGEEVDESDDEEIIDASREEEDTRLIDEVEVRDIIVVVEDSDWTTARAALKNLKKLAKRIHFSTALRDELQNHCRTLNIEYKTIKRTVATRWNTHVVMFQSAIPLREPLKRLCARHSDLPSLKAAHWEVIIGLEEVLSPFLAFTKRMETNSRPLIHEVIPLMDILTDHLETVVCDVEEKHLAVVRHAALRSLGIMDKYYSKTDDSLVNRASMILHPYYKLTYFEDKSWPLDWRETAKRMVVDHWETWYKPKPGADAELPASTGSKDVAKNEPKDIFARSARQRAPKASDALQDWLSSGPIDCDDPLEWWTNNLNNKNRTVDRHLARMAIDLLSTPATSCEPERGFSRGGLMVTKRRMNLKSASVRAGTVLSSWIDADLVPNETLIKHFNDKSKRGKDKGKAAPLAEAEIVEVVSDDDE